MAENKSKLIIQEKEGVAQIQFVDHDILEEASIVQIGKEISQLISRMSNPKVLINFEQVEHLSSSALGALITVNNKIKRKGGQLRLSNINKQIYEVFLITQLDKLFKIYGDVNEATESFSEYQF